MPRNGQAYVFLAVCVGQVLGGFSFMDTAVGGSINFQFFLIGSGLSSLGFMVDLYEVEISYTHPTRGRVKTERGGGAIQVRQGARPQGKIESLVEVASGEPYFPGDDPREQPPYLAAPPTVAPPPVKIPDTIPPNLPDIYPGLPDPEYPEPLEDEPGPPSEPEPDPEEDPKLPSPIAPEEIPLQPAPDLPKPAEPDPFNDDPDFPGLVPSPAPTPAPPDEPEPPVPVPIPVPVPKPAPDPAFPFPLPAPLPGNPPDQDRPPDKAPVPIPLPIPFPLPAPLPSPGVEPFPGRIPIPGPFPAPGIDIPTPSPGTDAPPTEPWFPPPAPPNNPPTTTPPTSPPPPPWPSDPLNPPVLPSPPPPFFEDEKERNPVDDFNPPAFIPETASKSKSKCKDNSCLLSIEDTGKDSNEKLKKQGEDIEKLANYFQRFAQLLDLEILFVINDKLGGKVDGGLSGQGTRTFELLGKVGKTVGKIQTKLGKFAKWARLGQLMSTLTFFATIHNAFMLSRNLGESLISMMSNGLALIGIVDDEGNAYDLSSLVGKTVENTVKGVVGAENYTAISDTLKKANRIYQASANVLFSIQSLRYSITGALETIGGWNARIGNALRKWGVVGEGAYGWMNPSPNFDNRFTRGMEVAEDVVSQIDSVASEVLSARETFEQLGTQKTELLSSLGVGTEKPMTENTPQKEAATASKEVSKSPDIDATDLVKPGV